jgi:hypothetical protein
MIDIFFILIDLLKYDFFKLIVINVNGNKIISNLCTLEVTSIRIQE